MTSHSHMIDMEGSTGAAVTSRILNDHYDIEKYVSRRAMFLGNPYWNRGLDIFKIARSDADEVFQFTTQKLSVQEVERREKLFDIEPRLSLPTTANTQTLDDFQSFPAEEWTPGSSTPLYIDRRSTSPPSQVNSGPSSVASRVTAGSSLQPPYPSKHMSTSLDIQRSLQVQSTIQARNNSANEAANTAMAFTGMQQTMPGNYSDLSSSPIQDSSFSSSIPIDPDLTIATSPMTAQDTSDKMQLDYPNVQAQTGQELAQQIINALGTERAKQATGYYAWEAGTDAALPSVTTSTEQVSGGSLPASTEPEVRQEGPLSTPTRFENAPTLFTPASALASRGMPLAVKPQIKPQKRARTETPEQSEEEPQKQGSKKRPRSETPASSEQTEDDQDIEEAEKADHPPPAKRTKLILKHSPKLPAAYRSTAPQDRPSRKKAASAQVQGLATAATASKPRSGKAQQAQAQATISASTTGNSRPTRVKKQSSKAAANSIESVISGDSLPQTKAEAETAAKARIGRLIANYNIIRKSRKHRQIKPDEEVDAAVMPEHFYVSNFKKGKEDETVRCVCGLTVDDETAMVSCDNCKAWQHFKCVGRKATDESDYLCHVCDPFAHREVVAKLRKAKVLS